MGFPNLDRVIYASTIYGNLLRNSEVQLLFPK